MVKPDQQPPPALGATRARQGVILHRMRYVLGLGLAGALLALLLAWYLTAHGS